MTRGITQRQPGRGSAWGRRRAREKSGVRARVNFARNKGRDDRSFGECTATARITGTHYRLRSRGALRLNLPSIPPQGVIAAVALPAPAAPARVTFGLLTEGCPNALSFTFAPVDTVPVLLLPVALAPPAPIASNGAPDVPGKLPLAELFAATEATGLPAVSANETPAVPLLPNPATPLPPAASSPRDCDAPVTVVVPFTVLTPTAERLAENEAATPAPLTEPSAPDCDVTPPGPAPMGVVAKPLPKLAPLALYDPKAFCVALTLPALSEADWIPWLVICAAETDLARPLTAPFPSPLSPPATELCAVEPSEEPLRAVAVPPAWNEPVAVSPPVVLPFTPPLLFVKLFTPFGVSIATDTSCDRADTVPLPVPPTDPVTPESAVAESEPFCAVALPLPEKDAVPPVLVARPSVKEWATATRPEELAKLRWVTSALPEPFTEAFALLVVLVAVMLPPAG